MRILDLAGAGDPQATATPYIALLVSGMAAAEPDLKPADHFTPQGMKVLEVGRGGGCFAEVVKAGEGVKIADFVNGPPLGRARTVRAADHFTPQGMKVLGVGRGGGCFAEVVKAGEGVKIADFVNGPLRGR
ncbi:hypothetical protein ACFC96_26495, partial [Streptomyces sp. NPDC055955]|uniref:hypothetical protein n=1 Tax=Streptomyces sp. NPDC055955 TaxID=3345665 RepID=UPI0035DCC5E2